ncbi:MAG: response regulator [Chitinivibrionales bacterium]|nr:response regulator [Chitinivibrionales bacterium]
MKKPTIILADDEKPTRDTIAMILKSKSYTVYTAAHGKEVLDLIQQMRNMQHAIDVLITDIHMPVMNGTDLIDHLTMTSYAPEIIAITGFGEKHLVDELRVNGCMHFLSKPITATHLLSTVQKALGLSSCLHKITSSKPQSE